METNPFKKLEQFFAQFRLLSYKKGEMILRADDAPQGVYYLKEGYVRVFSVSHTGEDLTLIIFKPQDFFPILWGIVQQQSPYYIEAITSVEVFRAPKEAFIEFLRENPDVLFVVTQRITIRLGGLLKRMEYLVFGNAYTKTASIFLILAERFGEKKGTGISIPVPLTHRDIASLVGITRETASWEVKELEKKDLILRHGRVFTVKHVADLTKESLL